MSPLRCAASLKDGVNAGSIASIEAAAFELNHAGASSGQDWLAVIQRSLVM